MRNYRTNMNPLMMELFKLAAFSLCLSACTTTPTENQHDDHSHDDHHAKEYNSNILNCVGPSGHHVYEEEQTCPIDGKKFKALRLGTHSTMGLHLDWQPISYMRFPVAIPTCPKNGFIVDKKEFSKEEISQRKSYIESMDYKTIYKEKHASFFLLAKQSEALQENTDNIWWLYLNATWEADACGNQERYNQYANLVIEQINERKNKIADKDEFWPLSIIATDMYRRTGQFSQAQKQLNLIGTPDLEDQKANDFYMLAKKIMQKAISDKNTARVPIREPKT